MNKIHPATPEAKALYKELKSKGIRCSLEYWDGHKHIDICIPDAKIFIEIEGISHYTNAKQIKADFNRDHYSDHDGYDTMRIPNELLINNLDKIANAISTVVKSRK